MIKIDKIQSFTEKQEKIKIKNSNFFQVQYKIHRIKTHKINKIMRKISINLRKKSYTD